MSKKFDDILYQDKYHMVIFDNTRKHSRVLMRPKVRVIIHDKFQNKLLLLQDEWLEDRDYGYFLPEDILYNDIKTNYDKTYDESIKDALKMAESICNFNGIVSKNINPFLEDFRDTISSKYYYFLVTDFELISVETLNKKNWFSIKEILELIKNKAFYDEDVVGVLFTYFLQENEIIQRK